MIFKKTKFSTQSIQNYIKSRKSDMSGPAKTCPGGQVLTANQRKYFYFSEITPFHFLLANLHFPYKIICFNVQIYDLLTESCVLRNEFMIFKIHTREHRWNIFREYIWNI